MAKSKQAPKAEKKKTRDGSVSQVIGAVVDVEFPAGEQPELFEALEVKTQDGRTVVLEVEGAIGDNVVRTIAMDATDGFRRGDPVRAYRRADLRARRRRDAGAHVQRDRGADRRRTCA